MRRKGSRRTIEILKKIQVNINDKWRVFENSLNDYSISMVEVDARNAYIFETYNSLHFAYSVANTWWFDPRSNMIVDEVKMNNMILGPSLNCIKIVHCVGKILISEKLFIAVIGEGNNRSSCDISNDEMGTFEPVELLDTTSPDNNNVWTIGWLKYFPLKITTTKLFHGTW